MKDELKDFVASLDILNTVHGGVSEPYISLRENAEGHEVRVRVPGVSEEGLFAEVVNNNHLVVFYLIPVMTSGTMMKLPKVVYHNEVPDFIDALRITAAWEENEFIIRLPFSALSDGNHRRIKAG